MIKAIFFDFDGVLTREFNTSGTLHQNLRNTHPDLQKDAVTSCFHTHCGHLNTASGTFENVWGGFCECIGKEITNEILNEALKTVTKNEEMFELVRELHGKYMLGIITTNATERMRMINEEMHLSEIFDPIIVSGDVHATKNDGSTTIFDTALEGANCAPDEVVFIDNQKKNLITPEKIGMSVYWHDDKKNDVSALRTQLAQWGVVIA